MSEILVNAKPRIIAMCETVHLQVAFNSKMYENEKDASRNVISNV